MSSLVRKTHQIQDYTPIGSVGSTGQQMAGHKLALVEPGTSLSEVESLYLFDSSAMTTDEAGNFALTASGSPSNTNGIHGSNYAASLDGSNYYISQVYDNTPTNGILVDFWVKIPSLPGASRFFMGRASESWAFGIAADNTFQYYHTSSVYGATALEANTWYYICCAQDSTNGVRIWINGDLDAVDSSRTTLPTFSSGNECHIGEAFGGSTVASILSNVRFRDKVATQKDVDVAYATTYTWNQDASFPLESIDLISYVQEDGNSEFPTQYKGDFEVARYNNIFYRYGNNKTREEGGMFNSTDKLKIVGR